MNIEFKQKWIAALKNGEYEQSVNILRSNIGYCCLGVLCDVIDNKKWNTVNGEFHWKSDDDDFYYAALPKTISQKLNISLDEEAELVRLNDTERLNFTEIAQWIEENL